MAYISLGGFQRVQFEGVFFDFLLDVGGEIARTFRPLNGGFAVGFAIGSSGIVHCPLTSLARLDDGIASPTVVGTTALLHEEALCSHFDGLTDHGNLPPFTAVIFRSSSK